MNLFKRYLGLVFLIIAPFFIYELINGAITHIDSKKNEIINSPINWIVIIAIFTPIAIGLVIFGWYAFRGEYDHLPTKSKEIK
jgi:purine-cytosine permease-like protein